MDLAALELRAAQRMLVVRAHSFRFPPPPDALPAEELRHGLHGGALETALMLHLAPHKVRREAIDRFESIGVGLPACVDADACAARCDEWLISTSEVGAT